MMVWRSRFDCFSSSIRSVSSCSTTFIFFSDASFYSLAATSKDGHLDISDLLENNYVSLIKMFGESCLLLRYYSLASYNCYFLFVYDVCCELSFKGYVLTIYISCSSFSFTFDWETTSSYRGCFVKRIYLRSDQKLFLGVIGFGEYFLVATLLRLSDKGTSSSG